MHRWKKIIASFLAIILIILIAGLIKIIIDTNNVKVKVIEHLSSLEYTENEYKIDVTFSLTAKYNAFYPYKINVVFHDEPDATYHYRYDDLFSFKKEKEVYQSGITPLFTDLDKRKHIEHNRKRLLESKSP